MGYYTILIAAIGEDPTETAAVAVLSALQALWGDLA